MMNLLAKSTKLVLINTILLTIAILPTQVESKSILMLTLVQMHNTQLANPAQRDNLLIAYDERVNKPTPDASKTQAEQQTLKNNTKPQPKDNDDYLDENTDAVIPEDNVEDTLSTPPPNQTKQIKQIINTSKPPAHM